MPCLIGTIGLCARFTDRLGRLVRRLRDPHIPLYLQRSVPPPHPAKLGQAGTLQLERPSIGPHLMILSSWYQKPTTTPTCRIVPSSINRTNSPASIHSPDKGSCSCRPATTTPAVLLLLRKTSVRLRLDDCSTCINSSSVASCPSMPHDIETRPGQTPQLAAKSAVRDIDFLPSPLRNAML